MQDAAQAAPSGMVALIGADEAQAQAVCDEARGADVLVSANFNAPGQVVISGSKAACERAVALAISDAASEIGMAKPRPSASVDTAVLMPMTRP